MKGNINGIKICGIASAVPKHVVNNTEHFETMSKREKRQIELTGIEERRVCINGQNASDLAAYAGEKLLAKLNWHPNSIRVLIYVTQTSDLVRPGSSLLIQSRLGIGKECLIYDINQGCAGFSVGLTTMCSILSISGGRGLLFVGECASAEGENIGRHAFLSGDGAAVTALESIRGNTRFLYSHYSDGNRANLLFARHDGYEYMDGNAILLFAISEVADGVKQFLAENEMSYDDVDFFVFHQAQKMIVEGIVQTIKIPEEKVLMSCRTLGNTSSASIPITISKEFCERKVQGKKKLVICGFGIGLSWGVNYIELEAENVLPLMETDYVYDDKQLFMTKENQE